MAARRPNRFVYRVTTPKTKEVSTRRLTRGQANALRRRGYTLVINF